MTLLPKPTLLEMIDSESIISKPRPHIGYSQAGTSCDRAIWYSYHWVLKREIPARLQRIFATGHIMENYMIDSLESIGIKVTDEQKLITGPHGHILGHIDGICTNVPYDENAIHLLEMKTANNNRFKSMEKKGVKVAEPAYYAQMQAYMGKLELSKGLFMVYNKNDSSYYIEIVDFDLPAFEILESKLVTVLYSEFPLDKIGEKTWFECKYCDFYQICHNDAPVAQNCRTCKYVEIEDNGQWHCSHRDVMLDTEYQLEGCGSWDKLKHL